MRKELPEDSKKWRIRSGRYGSEDSMGMTGAFFIPCPLTGSILKVLSNDADVWKEEGMPDPPWEHVSVSLPMRCPTWEEMCFIKGLFWKETELVVQYHPPEKDYVNNHPFTLHLWRPVGPKIPMPPPECV